MKSIIANIDLKEFYFGLEINVKTVEAVFYEVKFLGKKEEENKEKNENCNL